MCIFRSAPVIKTSSRLVLKNSEEQQTCRTVLIFKNTPSLLILSYWCAECECVGGKFPDQISARRIVIWSSGEGGGWDWLCCVFWQPKLWISHRKITVFSVNNTSEPVCISPRPVFVSENSIYCLWWCFMVWFHGTRCTLQLTTCKVWINWERQNKGRSIRRTISYLILAA